jgi:hypothetical protein
MNARAEPDIPSTGAARAALDTATAETTLHGMVEDLDRQIAALQRDTRYRQAITASVVLGVLASVITGLVAPLRYPWLIPSARSLGMMLCLLVPFAICLGLGHAAYRLLRWLRR